MTHSVLRLPAVTSLGVGHISAGCGAHTPPERRVRTAHVTGLLVEGLAVRGGRKDRPLGRHSLHERRRRAPIAVRVAVVRARGVAFAGRRRAARAARAARVVGPCAVRRAGGGRDGVREWRLGDELGSECHAVELALDLVWARLRAQR